MSPVYANQIKKGIITQNLSHILVWKCNPCPKDFLSYYAALTFQLMLIEGMQFFCNAAASYVYH